MQRQPDPVRRRRGPAWGVVGPGEIVPLPGEYDTTADVLDEGVKLAGDW